MNGLSIVCTVLSHFNVHNVDSDSVNRKISTSISIGISERVDSKRNVSRNQSHVLGFQQSLNGLKPKKHQQLKQLVQIQHNFHIHNLMNFTLYVFLNSQSEGISLVLSYVRSNSICQSK
jgi:hypothetical protein